MGQLQGKPVLNIPLWLFIWIAIIALIKIINIISGLVAAHTVMNMVTGIVLFILPLTITRIDLKYSGALVSAVATFAAIQEGHNIRTEKCGICRGLRFSDGENDREYDSLG